MTSRDHYQSLAILYDYLVPDPPGMNAFYLDLVDNAAPAGPVLEIGAGTGRLSIRLALAGVHVVATDVSPAMLAVLHTKATRLSDAVRDRLAVQVADQRALDLSRRFPVVLVTGGTLQHCLTPADYAATLAALRAHVDTCGILALDIARMTAKEQARDFRRDYGTYSGAALTRRWTRIRSWDEIRHDRARGVSETVSFFEMHDAAGRETDRFQYDFLQTFPGADALRDMIEQAGFIITRMDGGFRGEPLSGLSNQIVITARAS
jgi:SAM-dependent methyltransferase